MKARAILIGTRLMAVRKGMEGEQRQVDRIAQELKADLVRQYERVPDMSLYTRDVAFSDPVVTLRGKLNYAGMLTTILMFARILCTESYFNVMDMEVGGSRSGQSPTIETKWETGFSLRTGQKIYVAGNDTFVLKNDLGTLRISEHRSSWDRKPNEAFVT